MKNSFIKRALSLVMCFAVAAGAVTLAQTTAFAAEETYSSVSEYGGERLDVPQIRVTTEEGNGTTLQKDDGYQDAEITITDTDGSVLSGEVEFKVRGNTTALTWVTKKAYTFKFSKKKDVLGMGKGKKWALIANAFDPTLLRNYAAFDMAHELGLDYTSNQKFVELWVDGSFRGCYILYEPVQEGKDRVDIDIESNDGKKDFLLEYEAVTVEDDVTYITCDNKRFRFALSEPEEPEDDQVGYVQNIMDDIVAAIKTGVREDIEQKIDLTSFAKFYLLNEYEKTFDFERTSVFFYYKNGKLYAGPVWDFDISTGNEESGYSARAKNASETSGIFANKNLYYYLARYAWFNNLVSDVYKEHYSYFENIAADGGLLDSLQAEYKDVFDRNYNEAGWNISKWWVNHIRKPDSTYRANYDYLKNWCAERNDWMTEHFKPFGESYLSGDADNSGDITISDVTKIQRIAAGLEEDTDQTAVRCDLDGKGLNVTDALKIQRYIAKYKNVNNLGCQLRY